MRVATSGAAPPLPTAASSDGADSEASRGWFPRSIPTSAPADGEEPGAQPTAEEERSRDVYAEPSRAASTGARRAR